MDLCNSFKCTDLNFELASGLRNYVFSKIGPPTREEVSKMISKWKHLHTQLHHSRW